jgi:hypothetical protein
MGVGISVVSVKITLMCPDTGRVLDAEDDCRAWIQPLLSLGQSELAASPRAKELRDAVQSLTDVCTGRAVFYRALKSRPNTRGWKQMGPPPPGRGRDNRYNRKGETVLYLSSSVRGVLREVPHRRVCVQQYILNFDRMRVADVTLSHPPLNARVAWAFHFAEGAAVPRRICHCGTSFVFGQFLAGEVRSAGFDGFLTPGARGKNGLVYQNLVMFDPEAKWKQWSVRRTGFLPVRRVIPSGVNYLLSVRMPTGAAIHWVRELGRLPGATRYVTRTRDLSKPAHLRAPDSQTCEQPTPRRASRPGPARCSSRLTRSPVVAVGDSHSSDET